MRSLLVWAGVSAELLYYGDNVEFLLVCSGDGVTGNPIGRLQEMCIALRWTPPIYETSTEEGQPHKKNFVMTCTVMEYKETGEGNSKKMAKRRAAHKMLNLLSSRSPDELDANIIARFGDLKDIHLSKMTSANKQEHEQLYNRIRDRNSPAINELKVGGHDIRVHRNGHSDSLQCIVVA